MQAGVPAIVVGRLPIYLRALTLLQGEGKEVTSSQELGKRLGISSAQIRKDLSHFGEFGKQGTGYKIAYLQERLQEILHLNHIWPVALIGFGDLGHALVHYRGFREKGFIIKAIFDSAPAKIGLKINDLTIKSMDELREEITKYEIKMAILAVPLEVAQHVSEALVEAGVKAILNYAPITLSLPHGIQVQNIDPVVHLQQMTYYL
jgi:redox-sensing transcriptional repressor